MSSRRYIMHWSPPFFCTRLLLMVAFLFLSYRSLNVSRNVLINSFVLHLVSVLIFPLWNKKWRPQLLKCFYILNLLLTTLWTVLSRQDCAWVTDFVFLCALRIDAWMHFSRGRVCCITLTFSSSLMFFFLSFVLLPMRYFFVYDTFAYVPLWFSFLQ